MELKRIKYSELNARAKENYNCAKLAAILVDYGFVCLRLTDDWQGADILAKHIDGEVLQIQVKGRFNIESKYSEKGLWMAFPEGSDWYLAPHDVMVDMLVRANPDSVVARRREKGEGFGRSIGYLPVWAKKEMESYKLEISTTEDAAMKSLSESVAETWEDEEVRAKRSRRWGCRVTSPDGLIEVYESVRQAYEHIYGKDPEQRHIMFRIELVNAGSFERDGYQWEVFRKN